MSEFDGIRASLYKEALKEFPNARLDDIGVMMKYLAPWEDETILEVGAGSGFFSKLISEKVGEDGKLIVSDPSKDQLDSVRTLGNNIEVLNKGAEDIDLKDNCVDAIWSFGALHHCFNKKRALGHFKRILKEGGRIVIGDVFADSRLAKHFDEKVDKYSITGHKVEFWTDDMVRSICDEVGLPKPEIIPLDIHWKFNSEEDIGKFLYKLHAMTKTTPEEVLKGAKEILGVQKVGEKYWLSWPMKVVLVGK